VIFIDRSAWSYEDGWVAWWTEGYHFSASNPRHGVDLATYNIMTGLAGRYKNLETNILECGYGDLDQEEVPL